MQALPTTHEDTHTPVSMGSQRGDALMETPRGHWHAALAWWPILLPLAGYSLLLILATWGACMWLRRPPPPVVAPPSQTALYQVWLTGATFVTQRVQCSVLREGMDFPVFAKDPTRNAVLMAEYAHEAFAEHPVTCAEHLTLYERYVTKGAMTP